MAKAAVGVAPGITSRMWIGGGSVAGIVLLVVGGIFALNRWNEWRANQVLTEAYQLVQKARQAEESSYTNALESYKSALEKTRQIIEDYPGTSTATKLLQPGERIDTHTISELTESIIPKMHERAELERAPLAVAAFVANNIRANTISEIYSKGEAQAALADAYSEVGHFDRALQVASLIEDAPDYTPAAGEAGRSRSWKATALRSIARNYAKAGQMEKAMETVRAIEKDVTGADLRALWKDRALVGIAGTLAESGQLEQALQIANTISYEDVYYVPKYEALTIVAGQYAEAGQVDQAMQIAQTMKGDSKLMVLVRVVDQYAKSGQLERALTIAKSMKDAFSWRFDGYAGAMASIACGYAHAGQFNQALDLAKGEVNALACIVGEYVQKGQSDEALHLVETIEPDSAKAGVLAQIVAICLETGRVDEARRSANAAGNATDKAKILIAIAAKYISLGRLDQARLLLNQAIQTAETIEDISSKNQRLASIAGKYSKIGQKEKAMELFSRAIQHFDDYAKPYMVAEYSEDGQFNLALHIVKTIDVPSVRVIALADIGKKYARSGHTLDDDALRVLHDIIAANE